MCVLSLIRGKNLTKNLPQKHFILAVTHHSICKTKLKVDQLLESSFHFLYALDDVCAHAFNTTMLNNLTSCCIHLSCQISP